MIMKATITVLSFFFFFFSTKHLENNLKEENSEVWKQIQ